LAAEYILLVRKDAPHWKLLHFQIMTGVDSGVACGNKSDLLIIFIKYSQ
jgi:hypothetical protein